MSKPFRGSPAPSDFVSSYEPLGPDGRFILPPLKGSAKQVAWAQSVRTTAIAKALASIPMQPTSLRQAACDLADPLMVQDSAGWWIDHRADNFAVGEVAARAAVEALRANNPCVAGVQ